MQFLDSVRDELVNNLFPPRQLVDLQHEVTVDYFFDYRHLLANLFASLPFGRLLIGEEYYNFLNTSRWDLVPIGRCQLLAWNLTRTHLYNQEPLESHSIFVNTDYLWHLVVPDNTDCIRNALREEERVQYLGSFSISFERIKLQFDKIRLCQRPPFDNQLVIIESIFLRYKWTDRVWSTVYQSEDPSIVNP